MRCFAIIAAVVLVAAQANAFNASQAIRCISEHMSNAMAKSMEELNKRVEDVGDETEETKQSIRTRLEGVVESFNEDLQNELSKIDTKCDTGNLGQRGLCVLKSRAEMVVAATSTGTKAFRKASAIVAEHAQDFGSNRLEGAKNLGKMIASGLSNLLKASRECL